MISEGKYDINILAVKNEGEVSIAVSPNTVLIAGSTILVLEIIRQFKNAFISRDHRGDK